MWRSSASCLFTAEQQIYFLVDPTWWWMLTVMIHLYYGDYLLMIKCVPDVGRWDELHQSSVDTFYCTSWTTKVCCKEIIKTICSAPRRPSFTSLWTDHLLFLTIIRLLIVEIDFPKCQTVPGELPVFSNCSSFRWLTAAMLLCAVRGAANERKRRQLKYEICSENMLRDVWCFITGSAYYTICIKQQHVSFIWLISIWSLFYFINQSLLNTWR